MKHPAAIGQLTPNQERRMEDSTLGLIDLSAHQRRMIYAMMDDIFGKQKKPEPQGSGMVM